MAQDLYLCELTVYDPSIGGLTTLRYATGNGFITTGSETPASTWYDGRLQQPAAIKRDLFASGTTQGRSRVGYGDLVLLNGDGNLDTLLTYGWSGRSVIVRRGAVGAAYPGGFATVFSGTAEQCEVSGDTLVVKLRDRQLDLAVPLQPNKYAGNNVLPDGLEGVAGDLAGKPKPFGMGKVQNLRAVCVNTAKLIYQVHDGAVTSIDAVYDSGVQLLTYFPLAGISGPTFGSNAGYCFAQNTAGTVIVAGGANGVLYSSPDGVTWTSRTSTFGTNVIYAICWSAALNLFVAVGQAGNIATSSDGQTWTNRTSFTANDLFAVAASGSIVVAAGVDVGSSTTAVAGWTARTSAWPSGGSAAALGMAYGVDRFVAVVNNGQAAFSLDGLSWSLFTDTTLNGGASVWTCCVYTNSTFLAGGSHGEIVTSVNGQQWTARTSDVGASFGALFSFAYTPLGYFASYTGNAFGYSADGVQWQQVTPGYPDTIRASALAYFNGQLLVNGFSNLYTSSGVGSYPTTVELVADALAPAAGRFKPQLSGGYFRLGAPPAGDVTADVTFSTTANSTAGQMFATVLQRAGKGTGDWSASDVTALDALNSAVLGYWTDAEILCDAVLDQVAGSVGGWWGVDQAGVYTIQRFDAPSGTAVLSLTANDLLRPLARVPVVDDTKGIPTWRYTVRYGRNYLVQDTGLAAGTTDTLQMESDAISAGITDARRAFLGKEWREAKAEDAAVRIMHLLAPQSVDDSLLYAVADAQAEAARRLLLRNVLRNRYELVLQLNDDTYAVDLGDVISLTHSRYGLSGGALFRVIGVAPDIQNRTLTLQVWGPADPVSRLRAPILALSGTGKVGSYGSGGAIKATPTLAGTGTIYTRRGSGTVARSMVLAGTGTVT